MYELPKLPYQYNELEPYIDELTMTIHHTKHHQAYIDNANKVLTGTEFENFEVEQILRKIDGIPESIRNTVRNNAGGHYNHSLFWNFMGPGKGGSPSAELSDMINKKFESFDKFTGQFNSAAIGRFGSGWAWLVLDSNKNVSITSTANQDSPISANLIPLLGVDVWEHAYYLKYQNRRAEYLKNWWNVVNWDFVESRLKNSL